MAVADFSFDLVEEESSWFSFLDFVDGVLDLGAIVEGRVDWNRWLLINSGMVLRRWGYGDCGAGRFGTP